MEDWISVAGLVFGGIGTLTGVISFVWHLVNMQAKLKIEYFTFSIRPKVFVSRRKNTIVSFIESEILINNFGSKPTSVYRIYASCGTHLLDRLSIGKKELDTVDIPPSGSKKLKLVFEINEEEHKQIANMSPLHFSIIVKHTYGKLKRTKTVSQEFE